MLSLPEAQAKASSTVHTKLGKMYKEHYGRDKTSTKTLRSSN